MHIPRIYRGCTKLISWRLQHWTTGGDLMFYLTGHVIRAWFLSLGFSRAGFLEIVALINGAQPPGAIEGGQSFHVPPLPVKVYKDCSPDFSSLLSSVSFVSAPYSSLPWLLLHYAPRTTQLQSHTPFEGFLATEMVLLKQSGKFPYQLIALVMFIVIEHSRRALIYFSGLTGCTSGFRHLWCSEKSELLKPTEPLTGIYLNKGWFSVGFFQFILGLPEFSLSRAATQPHCHSVGRRSQWTSLLFGYQELRKPFEDSGPFPPWWTSLFFWGRTSIVSIHMNMYFCFDFKAGSMAYLRLVTIPGSRPVAYLFLYPYRLKVEVYSIPLFGYIMT